MKTTIKTLVIAMLISIPLAMFAQNPPHPNSGNAPGPGNTPVGGGAPIDGGMGIMMALAAAYGTRKSFFVREKK